MWCQGGGGGGRVEGGRKERKENKERQEMNGGSGGREGNAVNCDKPSSSLPTAKVLRRRQSSESQRLRRHTS